MVYAAREITSHVPAGKTSDLKISVLDHPDRDGICGIYVISRQSGSVAKILAQINFQSGDVADEGVNGVSVESLLTVVADHLGGFQNGPKSSELFRNAAKQLTAIRDMLILDSAVVRDAVHSVDNPVFNETGELVSVRDS